MAKHYDHTYSTPTHSCTVTYGLTNMIAYRCAKHIHRTSHSSTTQSILIQTNTSLQWLCHTIIAGMCLLPRCTCWHRWDDKIRKGIPTQSRLRDDTVHTQSVQECSRPTETMQAKVYEPVQIPCQECTTYIHVRIHMLIGRTLIGIQYPSNISKVELSTFSADTWRGDISMWAAGLSS